MERKREDINKDQNERGTRIWVIILVFCFIMVKRFQDRPIFKVLGSYFLSEGLYRITVIRPA